ncbi:GTP-binding protein [uncultured Amnibacterium sp.]|uniref:GTP-binding protein n=1 Tax=uncultured Amnibacterium sp. TaxID=1631851 RepID=UPI0035C9B456
MLPQHTHRPRVLDLGVLAHIDAGKTSLTERLLFDTGAVASLGSVDAGTTRTDSMDLERRRGITIRAAVTAVRIGGLDVNVIDTPGHTDFVAEVERALGVLDAAVLVLSAVEGVQPQTVAIWRSLRRVGVPTLLFVNKVDRASADPERAVAEIRERLTADLVRLDRVSDAGTAAATVARRPLDDPAVAEPVIAADDVLLQRWSDGLVVAPEQRLGALRAAVGSGALFPVLCGSAVTGVGVDGLRWAIEHLVPPAPVHDGALAGSVFAVDRVGATRRTWLRLWAGELRVRDRVALAGRAPERVTHIVAPTPSGSEERQRATAGELVAVGGLATARIGDVLGSPPSRRLPRIAPATLRSVVEAVDPAQRVAMVEALKVLADEDPLIDLAVEGPAVVVRIHGEVQREVIASLLDERFGVATRFSDTVAACIERLEAPAAAAERLGEAGNPYLATVGLAIEPLPGSDEVLFAPGVQRGRLPASFVAATEEGVRHALGQGQSGWPVRGVRVTMTASAYWPRQSHAHQRFDKSMSSVGADFRLLTPVVVAACLRAAGTRVCEPIERFDAEVPEEHLSALLGLLGRSGGVVEAATDAGRYRRVEGTLPSAQIGRTVRALPDLAGGQAVLTSRMDHYRAVADGRGPTRERVGPDPADRLAWFRAMPR